MGILKFALLVSVLFVVGTTVWVVREQRGQKETLPVYGRLDSFQLVNQNGTLFDSDSFKGRISIVNFIFSSCPHVCPLLTRQMAKIQDKTRAMPDVQLISISVDPKRDTPEALLSYGVKYGADFRRWSFLTGPLQTIRRVVVKGFMNAMGETKGTAQAEPDLFEITHGENFVILDKKGEIRAFRQAKSDREIHRILKIVRQLEADTSNSLHTSDSTINQRSILSIR